MPQLDPKEALAMAKSVHYARQGNARYTSVCAYLDRHGDMKHTLYGGKAQLGGCMSGCGTWWPDYGPVTRDFSPGGINHPTEHVFEHEVMPFTEAQKSQSDPSLIKPREVRLQEQAEKRAEVLTQFRHPQPEREALWASTLIMPAKRGGRRKCSEASNWKAALSTGKEGYKHGGRMPIFAKGFFLDNPDQHQKHPLKRGEPDVNIHQSCVQEQLCAGAATGTSPIDSLVRSSKTSKALGLRDSEQIIAEKTINSSQVSHSQTFKHAATRLNGNAESFHSESFRSFRASPTSSKAICDAPKVGSVTFAESVTSVASSGEEPKLPNWIAPRTVATRDPNAAGGQAGATALRRIALPARPQGDSSLSGTYSQPTFDKSLRIPKA